MAFVTTFGFTQDPDKVGVTIGNMAKAVRSVMRRMARREWRRCSSAACFCNWMVSTGVVGAMISTSVPGKVIAMWMPILVFFYMVFEHSVVNMFLFPSGLMLHAKFSIMDYLIWNEIPTVLGNLVGGIGFYRFDLIRHARNDAPSRKRKHLQSSARPDIPIRRRHRSVRSEMFESGKRRCDRAERELFRK